MSKNSIEDRFEDRVLLLSDKCKGSFMLLNSQILLAVGYAAFVSFVASLAYGVDSAKKLSFRILIQFWKNTKRDLHMEGQYVTSLTCSVERALPSKCWQQAHNMIPKLS